MGRHLSEIKKAEIVGMSRGGASISRIVEMTSVPRSTVHRVIKSWREKGHVRRQLGSGKRQQIRISQLLLLYVKIMYVSVRMLIAKSGAKPRLSPDQQEQLLHQVEQHPTRTAMEFRNELSLPIADRTVRFYLNKWKWINRPALCRPDITFENAQHRVTWAAEGFLLDESFWRTVIWSDECRFARVCDGPSRVWVSKARGDITAQRLEPRNVMRAAKHGGGGVMVWGCINYNGVGEIRRVSYLLLLLLLLALPIYSHNKLFALSGGAENKFGNVCGTAKKCHGAIHR